MGARIAAARAFALHDSNYRLVSLEFSLVAIVPSRFRNLRCRGIAAQSGVSDSGYSGAWTRRFDERCRVDLPHDWFVRFPVHLDFSWISFGLGLFGIPATSLGFSIMGARRNHILRIACHVSLRADKLWSSPI